MGIKVKIASPMDITCQFGTMKFVIAFVAVVAVASAQFPFSTTVRPGQYRPIYPSPVPPRPIVNRAPGSEAAANIVRYENDIGPDGSYQYAFETDNGIAAQAQGVPKSFGGNPPLVPVVSQGSYSYTSPEGVPILITYIADENGYQPQGDSLPTPPPIPDYILRSIEYNLKNPQQKK